MIRVNGLSTINFVSRPAFRGDENKEQIESTEQNVSMKGTEALASYNLSILKHPEKLDNIEPLELIFNPQEEIEGERIYTSEGRLRAIVKEDENTKTIYTPDEENENLIASAEVIDKNTQQVLMKQTNYIEDGQYDGSSWVSKYADGRLVQDSSYQNGELTEASINKIVKNNQELSVSKNIEDKEYRIYIDDEKNEHGFYVTLDENKQPKSYGEYVNNSMRQSDKYVKFYNGSVISVEKSEKRIIPNQLGREKLNNPELLPAPKYKHGIDLKGQKGEISYYSNGAIEKNIINDGETTAYFDINGNLEKVKEGNKEFNFYPSGTQEIIEDLGDGKKKITAYYNDGSGKVEIRNKDSYTKIYFEENKRPSSYDEGRIDENGAASHELSLYFNDKGMLTDTWG